MQHITCLARTQQRSILAIWHSNPSVFQSRTIRIEHYDTGLLYVDGFFSDADELGRFLHRLIGEHEIIDIDCRPVLPPQ
jgi:hypothetical protein